MTQPPANRSERPWFLALLASLAAIDPLAIDLYLPALPAIGHDLGASAAKVQWSVTAFLAGFSLGMLFYGPISDRYGRRPVLLTGLAVFFLASIGCLLARSAEELIVARFLQAAGGGAASVLSRAIVRDVYPGMEAIRKLSLMAMVTALAPLLAPLIGSQILHWSNWRGTFAALLLWGASSLVLARRFLPETMPPSHRQHVRLASAFAAYAGILRDAPALGLLLTGGMSFAAMFAYITASPHVLIEHYGFSSTAYALVFSSNATGILLANYLNSRLVHRLGAVPLIGLGAVAGVVATSMLLILFVLDLDVRFALFFLFMGVVVTGLLGANCVGLLMHRFPANAGAAAALFGASQFGFGVLASASVGVLPGANGLPMAEAMLVADLLALLGFFLYRRHGEGEPRGSSSLR